LHGGGGLKEPQNAENVNLHTSIYMKINEPERSSAQMELGVEFIRIRVGDRVGKNVHSRPLVVQLNKFTRKKAVSKN
jgi:hypothetical protein